jgi:hypothetical protein
VLHGAMLRTSSLSSMLSSMLRPRNVHVGWFPIQERAHSLTPGECAWSPSSTETGGPPGPPSGAGVPTAQQAQNKVSTVQY